MDQAPITFTHVSIENIKQEIMNGNENCLKSTKKATGVEELYDEDSQSEDDSLQHIKEEIDIEVAKLEEIEEGRKLAIINIFKKYQNIFLSIGCEAGPLDQHTSSELEKKSCNTVL